MDPGQRVATIQRIASRLAETDDADRNLILRQFGFSTAFLDDYVDSYHYSLHQVEPGSDEALEALDAFVRSLEAEAPHFEESGSDGPWRAGEFRLFISHTSAHKARAGKLNEISGRIGIHAFVAHEDIEPTREWEEEIERALRSCDALCAMLTPDFVQSAWCDQEVGMVVSQRKLILPLKMGADPHGFVAKYQAIPSVTGHAGAFDDVDKMLRAMARSPLTTRRIAPSVVRRFVRSKTGDAARTGFDLISSLPTTSWTPDLVRQVLDAVADDPQFEHSNVADGSGRPIRIAVEELLEPLRAEERVGVEADEDPPF
jgi:hypothetical protein